MKMATISWVSEKKKKPLKFNHPSLSVSSYPCKPSTATIKNYSGFGNDFIKNLHKWSSSLDQRDPLLKYTDNNLDDDVAEPTVTDHYAVKVAKAWKMRKTSIQHKYTTVEKLTIVSSFLPDGEKALIRQVSNLNEKVKHRLEQLDDFDESSIRKTMGLTQQEFSGKIHLLGEEIKKAWKTEQRVKAFKIAIQCSKLLADTSVVHFYPSKFILITDILDEFGDLVFVRLLEKSFGSITIKSINEIDSNMIPETAKETCHNWLYKMASIRELLPRLYLEITLLKCNAFIAKDSIKPAIERLTLMIRGVADPLVAVYLRTHLTRVAAQLLGEAADKCFYSNLKEFVDEYGMVLQKHQKLNKEYQTLPMDKYYSIYMPAVNWLMYGTLNSNRDKLVLLDELLRDCENTEKSELLLFCILTSFDSITVIERASRILDAIQRSSEQMSLLHDILARLGEHLCHLEGYHQALSESLAQTWWKIASVLKTPVQFLQVLEPWMEFACKHLSSQHVNIILRGTIRYMVKCGRPVDDFSGHFQLIFKRMLKTVPDVEELLLMDAFMPLVDLVQTSNARTLMAKTILSLFFLRYSRTHIDDPIAISCLMRLCCILHDSINAVTVEDEIKLCTELIGKFVQAVSYHDDADQQLNFYVECRGAFIKLDAVLVVLVQTVNRLSVSVASSIWLVRACAAYCFITVPSLRCPITRLHLYLLSGQVALLNNCIGQAEANLKAFVSLIPDVPEYLLEDGQKKPTQARLAGLLSDFLSTLLVLPDNIETNCKAYILSGFIKTLDRIHWRKTDFVYYSTLLNVLDLLCNMAQEDYSYHIDSVLSNDKLYAAEEEFLNVLDEHSTNIVRELLVVLKALGESKEAKIQFNLCIELLWRVIVRGDLEAPSMLTLATNLWNLAEKLRDSQSKLSKSIIHRLNNDPRPACKKLLHKLKEIDKIPETVNHNV